MCEPFKNMEVSFERFLHVYSIVKSQMISLPRPDGESTKIESMLIPIGHLIFNQSSSEPNATIQIEDGHVIVKANQEISAETKIVIPKKVNDTHDEFFTVYGHLQHNVPISSTVTFGIDDSVPMWDLKRCLLTSSVSSLQKILTVQPSIESQNLFLMLAFARFCVFDGDGKMLVRHNNMTLKAGFGHYPGFHYGGQGFNGMNLFPFDFDNEKTAWQVLSGAAASSLEKLESVDDADENEDSHSYSEKLVLRWRKGEKEAL